MLRNQVLANLGLPQYIDKIVTYALLKYPIDVKRVYTVGYSAGCRGVIRYNVFRPFVSVSSIL